MKTSGKDSDTNLSGLRRGIPWGFMFVLLMGLSLTSHAQLTVNISPGGSAGTFDLTASGSTGLSAAGSSTVGTITLSGNPFSGATGSTDFTGDLSQFNTTDVQGVDINGASVLQFNLVSGISGGPFSFSGGPSNTSLDSGTYSSVFNPGTYTITDVSGFLGSGSSGNFGTLTISAVPEPSSFAAIFGLAALGGAFLRRRPRKC